VLVLVGRPELGQIADPLVEQGWALSRHRAAAAGTVAAVGRLQGNANGHSAIRRLGEKYCA